MKLEILLLLCVATTITPGYGETKSEKEENGSRAKLPEFLSELDLSSIEASEEDVEALKRVVKRLAPEKNGEYQVYQVFFGNEDLLKEWLKGAGVSGQPGVDFPALTTIPATSFSCRGLKGGYYADLETNCQVFHICDNGRKISFLCPNGTIFQQSQLICDWWFKVDCSKSVDLYEQSAEQLAEEERKRTEARKMKSEFHRTAERERNQIFYQNDNADYDGRQNGRSNPYGQSAKQNQIIDNQQRGKSSQYNAYEQSSPRNQYQQHNDRSNYQEPARSAENSNQRQQHQQSFFLGHQSTTRQQNQLDNQNVKTNQFDGNYDQRGQSKYQTSTEYQSTPSTQDYYSSSAREPNIIRNEKSNNRSPKSRSYPRNNSNNLSTADQKPTPTYTETTTFRTTTGSPIKEYQQLAESAAFVSNRNNRFNGKAYSSQNYNYQSYSNQVSNANSVNKESTTSFPENRNGKNSQGTYRSRFGSIPSFPGPTFSPIYKPRTTTVSYETSTQPATTTDRAYYTTEPYYRQNYQETTYTTTDASTATTYSNDRDYYSTTTENYNTNNNNQYYQQNYGAYRTEQDSTYSTNTRSYTDSSNYESTKNDRDNTVTPRDVSQDTGTYSTTRSYVNTETYRGNAGNADTVTPTYQERTSTEPTSYSSEFDDRTRVTQSTYDGQEDSITTKDLSRTSQNYRQNSISASTEKPSRSTQTYQTLKTISPYDSSFTYQQGKVMSTLGPYVPFTKSYVSASTTTKPPVYTATVPTYTSTVTNYRATSKILAPKVKPSSTAAPYKAKSGATYLPEAYNSKKRLENRPSPEREHALGMLQSLRGLNNSWVDPTIPTNSGPSTLHSLALYFANANDNFSSNETTDSAIKLRQEDERESSTLGSVEKDKSSVELPISILTQHTINSYAELFNLNNALENNITSPFDDEEISSDEDSTEDLDIQQSEGPVNGAKKSNSTKLRELAQVFTHALSAYLQDPDTFKKVLTEIRPTEPTSTSNEDSGSWETTTPYPTTFDEYPSVTKEKDEVLDFSDDVNGLKRRKPTTVFPITTPFTSFETTYRNQYSSSDYYTTPSPVQPRTGSPVSNDLSNNQPANNPVVPTTLPTTTSNGFANQVNNAFRQSNANDISNYSSGPSGPGDASQVYDNYFPADYANSESKIAGFQNNSASTFEPYGKHVKPFDATPISDNYVASSTPATYAQPTNSYNSVNKVSAGVPDQELTPPRYYQNFKTNNAPSSTPINRDQSNGASASTAVYSTTPKPRKVYEISTTRPFRIRYYDTTTVANNEESLATARTSYGNYQHGFNEFDNTVRSTERPTTIQHREKAFNGNSIDPVTTAVNRAEPVDRLNAFTRDATQFTTRNPENGTGGGLGNSNHLGNDHWTSSPQVTQLWETTVFIDPKRINHGLTSESTSSGTTLSEIDPTDRAIRSTTPSIDRDRPIDDEPTYRDDKNRQDLSTPWQWAPNNNDSPTSFTLLPTSLSTQNTATPSPIITTRSSITTTITSSVTSTGTLPRESFVSSLLPSYEVSPSSVNVTENEILKAQEMFGKLNASSTNTLMRVMKQADRNETVRQLVLLLISHCKGPMNKTMENEKNELINALLKMPVNEFTSEESRSIISGINRLHLPTESPRSTTNEAHSTVTRSPAEATTFRRNRKYRTSTSSSQIENRNDNSVSEDTSASDSRALELLRSLYTIAAKWG